ncbi:DNA cytosine methyltransferase [archaeon]|nr:DNA cytosine methyltransferase [archaeon]|tara:strand:+ start:991 stop:1614 length:624 start_codon:yes stop_codon:yes gene_type:complete
MKVLNLYSGIGGNRKLWENVDVTAVELNPEIAEVYKDYFPNDTVIISNAHDYLIEHYKEFDFIWSSPPCQSHSKMRKNIACSVEEGKARSSKPIYPDLTLYQEIIFLQHYYKGKYAVENVQAFYDPLIQPQTVSRHWFWSNFIIPKKSFKPILDIKASKLIHCGFDLTNYKMKHRKDQILNNCVNPELGQYVFDLAKEQTMTVQMSL